MKALRLKENPKPSLFKETVKVLKKGGIVIIPTDTVYGFAVAYNIPEACERIYRIKGRRFIKPLTLFLKDKREILRYARDINSTAKRVMETFVPGPLTLVLYAQEKREFISPKGKIGIRIPNHPFIFELLENFKTPLATTSANLTNENEIVSPGLLKEIFTGKVDLLIDGGELLGPPSTVIDLTSSPPIILRKGKVSILRIEEEIKRKVKISPSIYFTVLFVCTGNSCRSPIAKALLEKKVKGKRILAYSAGTSALSGNLPPEEAIRIAEDYGIDISEHRSTPLNPELINGADLILVMEGEHYDRVTSFKRENSSKTFFLASYPERGAKEIEDPIGKSYKVYKRVAQSIEEGVERVVRDIMERL